MKDIEKLEDVQPDAANANQGTLRGAQLLERSLELFGAGRAIVVDKHGVCIAGNKTLEQAVQHGFPVRVVLSDGSKLVVVQRMDLDANDASTRRLGYLDNRSAEMGLQWDPEQIAKDLAAGFQFNSMFSGDELVAALRALNTAGGELVLTMPAADRERFERFAAHVEQAYAQYPQGDLVADAISAPRFAAWVRDQIAILAAEGLGPVQTVPAATEGA